MKREVINSTEFRVLVSGAPYNYMCGFCGTCFMGIGHDKKEADEWGERHRGECIRQALARGGA